MSNHTEKLKKEWLVPFCGSVGIMNSKMERIITSTGCRARVLSVKPTALQKGIKKIG